jgi:hypothetical protein
MNGRVVKLWYKYFDSLTLCGTRSYTGDYIGKFTFHTVCGMTVTYREEEAVIARAGAKCFYTNRPDGPAPQESALIRWGSDFAPALANTK